MISIFLVNIFLLINIIGYTYLYKYLFSNSSNFQLKNIELLYGFFFITFLSIILNFFLPLKITFYFCLLIGLYFGLRTIIKKNITFSLLHYFLIVMCFSIITSNNGENIDLPMYHMQIINWIANNKIPFGITDLEIRYGMNSSWHNFISLFNFSISTAKSSSFFTITLLSFFIIEALNSEKKLTISHFFLSLTASFIFFYTIIHPLTNGIILNHLGNPEVDIPVMIFFLVSFYIFLKIVFERKFFLINLLSISCLLTFTTKISYFAVLLLPIVAILIIKEKFFFNLKLIKNKNEIFVFFIFLISWSFKGYINSGCILFPVTFSCFDVGWGAEISEIDHYSKIIMGFARDTRLRARYTDFEYIINTYNWIVPWFKDYFLNTSLLKISASITFLYFCFFTIYKLVKKENFLFLNKLNIYIFLFFALCLFIWFKAPEVRFGWGIFISIPCFLIALKYDLLNKFKIFNIKLNLNFFLVILIFLLTIKNINYFNMVNFYEINKKYDYSNIKEYKKFNNHFIYQSRNWKCYDFELICVNSIKEVYLINKVFGHYIFKKRDEK